MIVTCLIFRTVNFLSALPVDSDLRTREIHPQISLWEMAPELGQLCSATRDNNHGTLLCTESIVLATRN